MRFRGTNDTRLSSGMRALFWARDPQVGSCLVSSGQVDTADSPLPEKTVLGRAIAKPISLHEGSPHMRAIRTDIQHIADTAATVQIRGQSGVGKDHVARPIHPA